MTAEQRCTGHCCEGFRVGAGVSDREWLPEDWRLYWLANAKRGQCDLTGDQKRLYRMLIWRYTTAAGDGVYGCKNFDQETRDCRIYETRPPDVSPLSDQAMHVRTLYKRVLRYGQVA